MITQLLKHYFDRMVDLELQVWEIFAVLGTVQQFPKEAILNSSYILKIHRPVLVVF